MIVTLISWCFKWFYRLSRASSSFEQMELQL